MSCAEAVRSHTGANLRDAIKAAIDLGCQVWVARRTGEYVVRHDVGRCRVNLRRKDAPRSLTSLLNRIQRALSGEQVDQADEQIEQPEITPEVEAELVAVTEDTLDAETEAVVEAPEPEAEPPPAPTPMSVTDRLRQYRGLRQSLVTAARERLTQIDDELAELRAMTSAAEQERGALVEELRELGAAPATVVAPSQAPVDRPVVLSRSAAMQRVTEFLSSHRGVWFSAEDIRQRVGVPVAYTLSVLMKPMLDEGRVERRGERRATLYRVAALRPTTAS